MLEPQRQHLLSFYRPVDVAFKVVGTGSVGLRDYCVYFEGNGPGDPLFLQIKEEVASAYAAYLPDAHPAAHNGQRVAEGQKAMQMQSDPFLGWTHIGGRQFLVRQLNDHKGSIELDDLAGGGLAGLCGGLRGVAGAGTCAVGRSAGDRRLPGIGRRICGGAGEIRLAYADQTEKDWEELRRSGKVGKKPTAR